LVWCLNCSRFLKFTMEVHDNLESLVCMHLALPDHGGCFHAILVTWTLCSVDRSIPARNSSGSPTQVKAEVLRPFACRITALRVRPLGRLRRCGPPRQPWIRAPLPFIRLCHCLQHRTRRVERTGCRHAGGTKGMASGGRMQKLTRLVLGNSGKPVTLVTLSLTKFFRHVFQG
jgi:hypothetical protein